VTGRNSLQDCRPRARLLGIIPPVRHVEVDGIRLAYEESGAAGADPVVLLHGYAGDHRAWRHQVPALAERHRVLAIDWPGWGESDRRLDAAYDYDTEIRRLGRTLDALEVERCNLFGHDYGGFLSLGFCLKHPGRVARLALLNTRAHRTFVPRWYATFGSMGLVGRTPGLRALAARLPHAAIHRRSFQSLVDRGVMDRELVDGYVGWMADDPQGGRWLLHYFADYDVSARPQLRDRLAEVACPAAIVWGRRDAYLSPRIAEELASGIPSAELTEFDDAGHFVMEERPADVTAALIRLLERPPRRV
jgi:pimeloyl-ACP methyl ester carboxylesterase